MRLLAGHNLPARGMILPGHGLRAGSRGPALDPDFVLVFDTTLASGTEVIVPLGGTVDCTIDWGDGNSDDYTSSGNVTHTYAEEGTYTVRVSGLLTAFGGPVVRHNLVRCLSFGEIGITSLERAFRSCGNLIEAPPALPEESSVTNMSQMFWSSSFNQDIGGWPLRTAGVNMGFMLNGAAMSVENYSRTLIGWANYVAANGGLPANVTLGASGRKYNDTEYVTGQTYNDAVSARAYLTSAGPGWSITDGGQA